MVRGDRIRDLRLSKRMTLEELGTIVGVGKGTVKKYENGTIENIPSDKIELLANALETTPEYLMGWVSSNTSEEQSQTITIKNNDVRILASGMDKMPKEAQEKALDLVRLVFEKYADYFEKDEKG